MSLRPKGPQGDALRWGLERVRAELAVAGGRDPVARLLVALADESSFACATSFPSCRDCRRFWRSNHPRLDRFHIIRKKW